MTHSRRSPVVTALAVLVTGGLLLVLRRVRRRVPAGGNPEEGGGLAGVREPRRPLPRDLVGAAAADPAE